MRTAIASATKVAATTTPEMPSASEMSAATPATMPAATTLRERSLWHTHQCHRSDSSKKELNQVRRA
ncbi:MAG: hypothetical protein WB460_18515 [Candidatus Acidiferrales bacterium]